MLDFYAAHLISVTRIPRKKIYRSHGLRKWSILQHLKKQYRKPCTQHTNEGSDEPSEPIKKQHYIKVKKNHEHVFGGVGHL